MTDVNKDMLAAARFIKEIGRGKDGARSLSRDDARLLYSAMLDGRVSDLELGAILLAMRVKGESVEEIGGFLEAAEASFIPLQAPTGQFAPVVLPSYNGSRHMANLTPLLALLLARQGVPVLMHGVTQDPRSTGIYSDSESGTKDGPSVGHAQGSGCTQFNPYAGQDHAAFRRTCVATELLYAPGIS